tara:strand:+ start:2253 stop:2651 length:399 start_codon:yes stop_codon:yes gene_type:complete
VTNAQNANGTPVVNLTAASAKAFEIWFQIEMTGGTYSLNCARGDIVTGVAKPAAGTYQLSANGLPEFCRIMVTLKRGVASTSICVSGSNVETLGVAASTFRVYVLDAAGALVDLSNGDSIIGTIQYIPGFET